MSDFQHKPNRGSLFASDKKTSDAHPTHKGSANIDGVEYWLSAWVNEKNGRRYFSLGFERKDKQRQSRQPQQPAGDFDSDLPF